MKPAPFDWHVPDSLDAALALKAALGEEARFIAGGQSLIPAMNFRMAQPAALIDLSRLPALAGITTEPDGGLTIGAMTRHRTVEHHPHPLLSEAMAEVAHPQIRARGTLGGNLAHADPASEMPAVMLALDASFDLRRAGGTRRLPAADFFLAPLTTALEPDEMLAAIRIPPLPPGTGTAFLELARRQGDYAMMGVAVVLTRAADRVASARLAFLSAGPTPMLAPRAAAALVGAGPDAFADAAETAAQEIDPMGSVQASIPYQRHLARVLARRALALAWGRAA